MGFIPGIMGNKGSFATGQKDVETAGTAVQLTTESVPVPDGCELTVVAKPGNAGNIFLGNSEENAESETAKFNGLEPGLAVALKVNNANLVWVNSAEDGDGVSYVTEQ